MDGTAARDAANFYRAAEAAMNFVTGDDRRRLHLAARSLTSPPPFTGSAEMGKLEGPLRRRDERPPVRAELVADVERTPITPTAFLAGRRWVRGTPTLHATPVEVHLETCCIGKALHHADEVCARARDDQQLVTLGQ